MYLDKLKNEAKIETDFYRDYREFLKLFRDLTTAGVDFNRTLEFDSFIELVNIIDFSHKNTKNKKEFERKLKLSIDSEGFEPEYID